MTSDFSPPSENPTSSPVSSLLELPSGDRPQEPDTAEMSLTALNQTREALVREITTLQEQKTQILTEQWQNFQNQVQDLLQKGTQDLENRRQALEKEIERLERRQERIQQEMRTTFAGASQELAIRLQGFKEYLVGSLQDLAAAADQLELGGSDSWPAPPQTAGGTSSVSAPELGFVSPAFADQKRQIQELLEQYRSRPDYYGPPWQLRRTFEPIHAERVQDWFFEQGGRGAVKTLGSRLQNILVGSAIISILSSLYGDRARALILAQSPERLGEWRRGLQDCLGISRSDFGPERGVVLFEAPEALIQKAERLVAERQLPVVIIDETQAQVDLALLQFPLWLAFVADPQQAAYLF